MDNCSDDNHSGIYLIFFDYFNIMNVVLAKNYLLTKLNLKR